jgi:hypothetical protein
MAPHDHEVGEPVAQATGDLDARANGSQRLDDVGLVSVDLGCSSHEGDAMGDRVTRERPKDLYAAYCAELDVNEMLRSAVNKAELRELAALAELDEARDLLSQCLGAINQDAWTVLVEDIRKALQ